MRKYKMPEKDRDKGVCWKYALACILGVNPKKVPDFMKKKQPYDRTRDWLEKKFKKTLAYVPINAFMETTKIRYNPRSGPNGYSIMTIETVDENINHAVIAFNGKYFYDPGDVENEILRGPVGYYIIYDL